MPQHDTISEATVMDLVICRSREGIGDQEMIEVADSIMPILRKQKAFVRRELRKAQDGRWVDLLWWTDFDGGRAAAEAVHAAPEGKKMDELFLEEGMIWLSLAPVRNYD